MRHYDPTRIHLARPQARGLFSNDKKKNILDCACSVLSDDYDVSAIYYLVVLHGIVLL